MVPPQGGPSPAFSHYVQARRAPSAAQLLFARRMQVPLQLGHQLPSQCHLQAVNLGLIKHIKP